jgi:ankyrin repeat protein
MKPEVQSILHRVKDTADFGYVDFTDINATNALGDNALHCVIVWDDYEAARVLIENGIDLEKHGEHGYTPLHEACAFGRKAIVELLLQKGADPLARTEGDLPFTIARLNSHGDICDLMNSVMKGKSDASLDASRKHINHLNDGIDVLKQKISSCEIKKSPSEI